MISSQKLITNNYGFYAHLDTPAAIDQAIKQSIAAQLKNPKSEVAIISPLANDEQLGIPYLTISDNLRLSIQKKSAISDEKMTELTEKLTLHDETFRKTLQDLSLLDTLKLQLLSAYCRGKKQIIIADIFSSLSTKEIQWILPTLQELANQEKIFVLIYTTDPKIARSPYVDQLI